jgi:NADH-quinone oxidoreductase subunit D
MTGDRRRELIAGTGAGLVDTDLVLTIGPHHPSTHGMLRLRLLMDGDRVVTAEPMIGYLHRGAEKLFEVRDYRQIIVLANRHDWLSAFANELGVALAVERLMGLEVPERAVWLRTALAELNRVLNHLMFLGTYPPEIGASPLVPGVFAAREAVQATLEEASGGRMHTMFNRVGGLKEEVPAGWTRRVRDALGQVRRHLPELDRMIGEHEPFRRATTGIGVLTAAQAAGYGVSGPVARASGLDLDLRRDEPYLAYRELDVPVVTRQAGDCHARYACLLDQVHIGLDLVDACLSRVDRIRGPVQVRLSKVVRAPEGHTYAWTESPIGINGYYLVSRGEPTPWRLKLRTASYANVQVLSAILPGCRVADLVPILGSMFFVVGDIDR